MSSKFLIGIILRANLIVHELNACCPGRERMVLNADLNSDFNWVTTVNDR